MPHLVSVDGVRIPLQPDHAYTLGRGRLSDIVLKDRASSRVHARLSVGRLDGDLVLEDLHSRNGSYLNGDLVLKPTRVPDGGRIRLGTSVFLARLTELQDEEHFAETGTVAFEQAEEEADLEAGELARVGLIEILTRLLIDRRNVTLHVAMAEEEARIEVRDGEIRAAECAGHEGFNALVRVGRQAAGIFWLTECAEPCEPNVRERPDRLLSQLARCLAPVPAR